MERIKPSKLVFWLCDVWFFFVKIKIVYYIPWLKIHFGIIPKNNYYIWKKQQLKKQSFRYIIDMQHAYTFKMNEHNIYIIYHFILLVFWYLIIWLNYINSYFILDVLI